MADDHSTECLICREHRGDVVVPGGFLVEDERVVAFHCPPMSDAPEPYLGYLFVTSRRHAPSFAELDDDEAGAVGVAISALSAALRAEGAERVYVATIGHGWDHLHVHLVPRWPGTPREVAWYSVDTWDGARRGGAEAVATMTEALRRHLGAAREP